MLTNRFRRSFAAVASQVIANVVLAISVSAQLPTSGGGEIVEHSLDDASAEIAAIRPRIVARARELGIETLQPDARPSRIARGAVGKLEFPLRQRPASPSARGNTVSNYVDLMSTTAIRAFDCSTRSYDGHSGIDYSLGSYGWRAMDGQHFEIVAAAGGVIVDKHDGAFDRNCFPLGQGQGTVSNRVVIRHDDGVYAYYFHIKKLSVTTKAIGARVARGEYLGLVGSSGRSSSPHLHFELHDGQTGPVIDPYAGTCGQSTTVTAWKHQHEPVDTEILRVATHSIVPPSAAVLCSNPDPSYADRFSPGATVYAVAYLKDQPAGIAAQFEIKRPDGSVLATRSSGTPTAMLRWPYWWQSIVLPSNAPTGLWTVRVSFNGRVQEHSFRVGVATATTSVLGLVDPQARNLVTGVAKSVTVKVTNTGLTAAEGCFVAPDAPLAATSSFQLLNSGGSAIGLADQNFSVPANSSQTIRLTLNGKVGATADNVELPIRVRCTNAMSSVSTTPGFNTMWLSFSATAKPDIVPTTPMGTGVAFIPGAAGFLTLPVTMVNAGSLGTLTVRARASRTLPVTLTVCELNVAGTACLLPPTASVQRSILAGQTSKWRVHLRATGGIPLNVTTNRVILEYVDASGKVRGQTSVAVRTH